MEDLEYKKLYVLQDEILSLIFKETTEFYLTGGTCLHRFFFEKRFSDDLDFFTNFSNTFAFSAREAINRLTLPEIQTERLVDEKDFIRLNINKHDISLQIDFVNDRVERFGDLEFKSNYRLDNPLNILSNKLSATIARDNPKDIFDICVIAEHCTVDWSQILADTKKKLFFQKEDLLYRLKTFPPVLLTKLKVIDTDYLKNFEKKLSQIITAIQESE